jgi:hypothetical protein
MMDQEQGTTTVEARASIVEFVDVEVIDDGGPKVLVKLGQINNGEPDGSIIQHAARGR